MPDDLTLVSDQDLADYETKAVAEFDRIRAIEDVTPEQVAYQARLADDIDRCRAESAARVTRAEKQAAANRAKLAEQQSQLETRVHGKAEAEEQELAAQQVDAEAITAAAAEGATRALLSLLGDRGKLDLGRTSLSDAQRHAPAVTKPRAKGGVPAITAGVDIPGIAHGGDLNSLDGLVDAFHRRAKGMPVTRGTPNEQLVASIHNEFEHTIDERSTAGEVEEWLRYALSDDKKNALVAGGGWCAPSEVRYDFFNIASVDGLIDLPTVGITRGGIRFPVSPSIADAFIGVGVTGLGGFAQPFDVNSMPWLWTEASDIATVTGSPNKPCLRVPCPTFSEVRLECYGVCVTAGNLTDSAYPEATQNFLRLVLAAHEHAQNARFIAQMVAQSTAVSGGGFGELNGAATQALGGLALAATDYRAKFAMDTTAVLEVVAPYWLKEVVRADIAHRIAADDALSVSDAEIAGYFADRNLRVQWVNDWQVRGASQFGNATTPMTAWPASVNVLVYAAGTFIKGNGMTLDLGVVRDSTLNAENDHTAAWSEECHLIARVGHESRNYTIAFNVSAITPPAATAAPNL